VTLFGAILVRPVLPIWLIALLLLVVAAVAWYTYRGCSLTLRQRLGLWGFRMAALLIIAWLLLQAEHRKVLHDKEAPLLAMVVDVSASMTEKLDPAAEARRERAIEFLSDSRIDKLCKRYRVVRYEIGSSVEESTGAPGDILFNGPRSNIGTAVNEIAGRLRVENAAGLILLSDGLDQSGESLSPQAMGVPVFIPEIEEPMEAKQEQKPDAWVADVSYPKMMVVNWKGNVDVLVRRRGNGALSFPIHFRQGATVLRSSMIEFQPDEQFKQVSFSLEPLEIGQILYQVEITPVPDGDPDNNSRTFLVEVTDPKNRVLYLEGAPRWEFKFLKRALLAEKNYQLSAFVQSGQGTFINFSEQAGMAGGATPKMSVDELKAYKVIIIGDVDGAAFKEADGKNLSDFVDRGGGLLFIGAGKAYGEAGLQKTPHVQEMLPALSKPGAQMTEGRFSVDFTPGGRAHPATSGLPQETRMPPVLSFWTPVKVSELSTTLIATADGSPILVVRRYGQGRVAMILSDSLWRWQMGGAEGGTDRGLYSSFVTQLVHWLAPSEKEVEKTGLLQVFTARSEVELRENVTLGAVWDRGGAPAGDPLQCRITTPDGRRLSFPMVPCTLSLDVGLTKATNGFKCMFRPNVEGEYQVSVTTPNGSQEQKLRLLAACSENEKTGAPLDRDYLESLAADTGGKFVPWKSRYSMFKDIPFKPRETQEIKEYPIWNRWVWVLALTALFCAEWWWRRRLDLV